MNRFVSRSLRAASLALALVGAGLGGSAQAAPTFSGLYVFGDSLSDNGNLFAMTGGFPPAPYYEGRFSNGQVAAELLATRLGLNATQFHDNAIAGATSGIDGQVPGTGLQVQVSDFVDGLGGSPADAGALYMVWAGANDFLHGDLSTQASTQAVIQSVVSNLVDAVLSLYNAGARTFLLPTLPDLGATPRVLALGPQASAGISGLSAFTNQSILAAYTGLATVLTDERFVYFDTEAVQHATTAAVAATGGNVTGNCLDDAAYPDCTGYYFFDDIHPTTATNAMLAAAMAAAVPEPGAMGLVLLALGGMVVVRRRSA